MAIKLNMEVMELMLFYWQATSDREKVAESFLTTISDHELMKPVYTDEFHGESVRRALSAITNKEIFRGESKCESRFWNNNMWAMEDMGLMDAMMAPLKVMNLDDIDLDGDYEVVVLPLHMDESYRQGNRLFLNFFRVQADIFEDGPLKVGGVELKEWITGQFTVG